MEGWEKSNEKNNQEHSYKKQQQSLEHAGDQNQLIHALQQAWHPPYDDEIDLADLAGVLFRRKMLIFGMTLVFACLAFGASMMMTKKYNAMTMVEIGQLLTNKGYEIIENSEAVKNRLSALAKATAAAMSQGMAAANNGQKIRPLFSVENDLKIEVPKNGTIISLKVEAPKESKALAVLSQTNQKLIEDHNRIFNQHRAEIRSQISRKELTINDIDIQINKIATGIAELKRQYERKTGQQKNLIKELTSSIQNIESQKKFIKEKIDLLVKEKIDLETRIKEAETRYERLMNSKLAANDQATGNEAVSLMLFSSELQHMQDYLSQLRDRLLLDIPRTISELDTNLQELDTQINDRMAAKSLEQKLLEQLSPELKEKIEDLKGQIQSMENQKETNRIDIKELENQIENMIITKVIIPPRFSENPVTPNVRLNVILGLMVGFFISVFLVFIIEFWQNNKVKIKSGGR